MKQIRLLAQYYVDLMMKLGLVRFSMLLALALVVLAIVVQMAVTMSSNWRSHDNVCHDWCKNWRRCASAI